MEEHIDTGDSERHSVHRESTWIWQTADLLQPEVIVIRLVDKGEASLLGQCHNALHRLHVAGTRHGH